MLQANGQFEGLPIAGVSFLLSPLLLLFCWTEVVSYVIRYIPAHCPCLVIAALCWTLCSEVPGPKQSVESMTLPCLDADGKEHATFITMDHVVEVRDFSLLAINMLLEK